MASLHLPIFRKIPVLVAIGSVPGACRRIFELILKANCNSISFKGKKLLDKAVLRLLIPLFSEKADNGFPALKEGVPISPNAVLCIGQADLLWVTGIPGIFSHLNLLHRISHAVVGWKRRSHQL